MVVETMLLIVGAPLLTARVSGSPVPVLKVQPCLMELWSSNKRFPIVRAPSRVTAVLAVKDSALKPAVAPTPLAATLFETSWRQPPKEPPAGLGPD